MQLFLVRHGESEWQAGASDNLDAGLSSRGHGDARRMATWLRGYLDHDAAVRLTSLLYSPLQRTRETARYIEHAFGLIGVPLESLREADFHLATHFACQGPPCRQPAIAITSSYMSFKQQAAAALDMLIAHAAAYEGVALAVTHSGVIRTMLSLMSGGDGLNYMVPPASITRVEWREGRWELVWLARTDYLPGGHPPTTPGART